MRVVVQSQARRVVIELTQEPPHIHLKVACGTKRGNTQLSNWQEAETIILGFVRKLRADEAVGTGQTQTIPEREVTAQPQDLPTM